MVLGRRIVRAIGIGWYVFVPVNLVYLGIVCGGEWKPRGWGESRTDREEEDKIE